MWRIMQNMNSMKLVIPLHFYLIKKDSKWCCDTTTPESIHTKDESKPSLVWIDNYNECSGMTSFMEFMKKLFWTENLRFRNFCPLTLWKVLPPLGIFLATCTPLHFLIVCVCGNSLWGMFSITPIEIILCNRSWNELVKERMWCHSFRPDTAIFR